MGENEEWKRKKPGSPIKENPKKNWISNQLFILTILVVILARVYFLYRKSWVFSLLLVPSLNNADTFCYRRGIAPKNHWSY